MSRVVRKETLHKKNIDMREIRSENSNFVILNKYSFCRASTLILDRYDSFDLSIEF